MLPIWRAIPPVVVLTALGAGLDRALKLELGAGTGRWVRWIVCALVACFAASVHPLVLALLLGVALVGRNRFDGKALAGASPPWRWLGVAAAIGALAVIARPATPMYWDAFVWLGKARIASGGAGALRAGTLDPGGDVIPRGYPLLWPLAASWLSMFGRSPGALTAGAAAMTLIALLLFLDAVADAFDPPGSPGSRPRWALGGSLALLATTPLVYVHLRSAYADLPVGLFAATCTLRLGRDLETANPKRSDIAGAAVAAGALAGLKDEGMAHVTVIVVAAILARHLSGNRTLRRSTALVMAAAAIPFVGWRMLLVSHAIPGGDHELGAPAVSAIGRLASVTFSSVTDADTWGALWWIATAAAGIILFDRRAFRPATLLAAIAFVGEVGILASALVFGPDRIRVFAFEGTLVNRLFLQLAPPAAAMLALAFGDAAARRS